MKGYFVVFNGEKLTENPVSLTQATAKVKAITSDVLSRIHFMNEGSTVDLDNLVIEEAAEEVVRETRLFWNPDTQEVEEKVVMNWGGENDPIEVDEGGLIPPQYRPSINTTSTKDKDIVEIKINRDSKPEDFMGYAKWYRGTKTEQPINYGKNTSKWGQHPHPADVHRFLYGGISKGVEPVYHKNYIENPKLNKKCECGKEKHGFASHSNWCPKHPNFEV